mgnify:CR=1 FL=1
MSLQNRLKSGRKYYRFCQGCGKVVPVYPVRFIEKNEYGYIYEAKCEKGHWFSSTLFGLSILISDTKLQIHHSLCTDS